MDRRTCSTKTSAARHIHILDQLHTQVFGGRWGGADVGLRDYHDFHLGEGYKSNTGGLFIYIYINLGVAPSQYSSDHQDYYIFRLGDPNLNIHFPLYWEGATPNIYPLFSIYKDLLVGRRMTSAQYFLSWSTQRHRWAWQKKLPGCLNYTAPQVSQLAPKNLTSQERIAFQKNRKT